VLQAGQTAPVVGRSEDGTWYVISFPTSLGEQGWVSAEVVTAANVENVPVIAPPVLPAPGETPSPTAAPQAPTALIDAPAQGQVGAPVTFSAARSAGTAPLVQYAWSFGDGSVADAVAVEKTYDAAGVYLVNLKVVDQNGQEGTAQHQITIGPAPQETPTPTEESGDIEIPDSLIVVTVDGAPATVAIVGGIPTFDAGVGQTVKLDATPALELYPTLQVSWDMGDGSPAISGISAEHQYNAASVYQIVIAATDGQQAVTKLWQVNVTE
jgi:PKD repeat protein